MHEISSLPNRLRVHVIGASGRTGRLLCESLVKAGAVPVPVIRNPARWLDLPGAEAPRLADLDDHAALHAALADASHIVSGAHARHTEALLAASGPDAMVVLLGSTRRFTRWPDAHGNGVIAGETALLTSGRRGVMLHPTMIYGAAGENNVQRLAALMHHLPLLQPIHAQDVVACILAALQQDWTGPNVVVIAGPEAVSYADFTRAIARADGINPLRVVSLPAMLLMLGAAIARHVPGLPKVEAAEIRRLLEDKDFDIAPMQAILGVQPRTLAAGLAETFAPGDAA